MRASGTVAGVIAAGIVLAACNVSGDTGYVEIRTVPVASQRSPSLYLELDEARTGAERHCRAQAARRHHEALSRKHRRPGRALRHRRAQEPYHHGDGVGAGAAAALSVSQQRRQRRLRELTALTAGQRMPRHQVIGMRPARQRLHALEPGRDVRVLGRDVEAELFGRIIEIGRSARCRRWSGDRRARRAASPAACRECRACCRSGPSGRPSRPDRPAAWRSCAGSGTGPRKPLSFWLSKMIQRSASSRSSSLCGTELAGTFGEVGEDHAGLASASCRREPAPALRPSR